MIYQYNIFNVYLYGKRGDFFSDLALYKSKIFYVFHRYNLRYRVSNWYTCPCTNLSNDNLAVLGSVPLVHDCVKYSIYRLAFFELPHGRHAQCGRLVLGSVLAVDLCITYIPDKRAWEKGKHVKCIMVLQVDQYETPNCWQICGVSLLI